MQKKLKQMMLAKMFTNFSIVLYLIISSAPLVSTWLGKLHTAYLVRQRAFLGVVLS